MSARIKWRFKEGTVQHNSTVLKADSARVQFDGFQSTPE